MSSREPRDRALALAASVLTCLRDAAGPDIRPRDAAERMWSIDYPPLLHKEGFQRRQHVDRVKRELFRIVASVPTSVLVHPDSPTEYVPGQWLETGIPGAYAPPRDLNLANAAVDHWLFALGNWSLFSEPPDAGPRPDFFRTPTEEILAWMDRAGPTVAIDSFHDDTQWVVAFRVGPPAV